MTIVPGSTAPPTHRRPRTRCRRFTVLDLMLAVGVAGVAFTGLMSPSASSFAFGASRIPYSTANRISGVARYLIMPAAYLILAWRLRPPRPSIRSVFRQWGAIACLVLVLDNLMTNAMSWSGEVIMRGRPVLRSLPDATWSWFNGWSAPFGVLTCWSVLKINRAGRREPGWVDHSGCLLGWYATVDHLASSVMLWLEVP